jgi:serine/threonine-protein kinase
MAKWVLIVDADLASNVLLSKTLTKAGFETRTAFTSDEALARASQDRFDLIVADLGLPGGDSKQLLLKLDQAGISEAVPVLALAGGLEDQLAKSAMQMGASEILAKPIAADMLVQRVRRAIERGPRGQTSQRLRKADRGKGVAEMSAAGTASGRGADLAATALDAVATTALEAERGAEGGARVAERGEREANGEAGVRPSRRMRAPTATPDAAPPPRAASASHAAAPPAQARTGSAAAPAPAAGNAGAAPVPSTGSAPSPTASASAAPAGSAAHARPSGSRAAVPSAAEPRADREGSPRAAGTLAASGPTRTLAASGAIGAPAAAERGKSGVSTIQLDARNFVDKHRDRVEAPPDAHGPLSEGDELALERRSYHVVRALAAGAMGGTYLVRRSGEPGSPFAEEVECVLKVSFGDPVADESLRVEQLVLGAIDHPNVVKLLDMGFLPGQDGARFVVLERLHPLPPAFLRRGADAPPAAHAVDPVTTMRVYLNLVGGLHSIHAKQRLILGDIKPDNVMLRMTPLDPGDPTADYLRKLSRGEFEPVFIDFGSALSQEVLHTRKVETFTGSPAYMAPEVLTQGRHSARRDVFALSLTLYEMLTGERPYGELGARPVPELVEAMRRGAPAVDLDRVRSLRFEEPFAEAAGPDPAAARAQFLRNVADMIARGADRDPAQRYSTYHLADECKIRFAVRPRPSALPGARYETALFHPIDPARNRYTRPPEPSEPPLVESASAVAPKPGKGAAPAPFDPFAATSAAASPPAPPPGIGHSAAAYAAGQGILGPPPAVAPAPVAGGAGGAGAAAASAAQARRLEIENAELRLACLRAEERAQLAEDTVAERDKALRRAEERARQLDETARERDQKRLEALERLKKSVERAQKAEEEIGGLEKALAEAERRAAEAEGRAAEAERAAAEARPVAAKLREATEHFEKAATLAREAAEGAHAIAAEAKRGALSEAFADLGPLVDAMDEASKDRPDDDPLRVTDAEAQRLLDALRALRARAGRPGA